VGDEKAEAKTSRELRDGLDCLDGVETDTDVMIRDDDNRPPCLGGSGVSVTKKLHTCGVVNSALAAWTNDFGNTNNENYLNYSSPSKQAIGSKRKGLARSPLLLSLHKASCKLSLLNDRSHTNTSLTRSSLLSTPNQVASTPVTTKSSNEKDNDDGSEALLSDTQQSQLKELYDILLSINDVTHPPFDMFSSMINDVLLMKGHIEVSGNNIANPDAVSLTKALLLTNKSVILLPALYEIHLAHIMAHALQIHMH
jgi:hypothetical protein